MPTIQDLTGGMMKAILLEKYMLFLLIKNLAVQSLKTIAM